MHASRKMTVHEPEGWLRKWLPPGPPGPPEPGFCDRALAFALCVWFQVLLALAALALFW